MHLGKSVFVFRLGESFDAPAVGLVTGEYPATPGAPDVVDVEAFFRRSSPNSPTVALERVVMCSTIGEVRKALANGQKYTALPYNPADPKLPAVEAEPAPKPKK